MRAEEREWTKRNHQKPETKYWILQTNYWKQLITSSETELILNLKWKLGLKKNYKEDNWKNEYNWEEGLNLENIGNLQKEIVLREEEK